MKPEYLFFIFLIIQFSVVFFVVVKFIIDRLVERKFEQLHKESYPDAHISDTNRKIPFFRLSELMFLIVSPAVMGVAMIYSLKTVLNPAGTTDIRSQAAASQTVKVTDNFYIRPEKAAEWQKILDNVPLNPNQVLATASANGNVKILTSEKPYPYDEITFTWSGDKAVEPGANVIGYRVIFGTDNTEIAFPNAGWEKSVAPSGKDGIVVKNNSYKFTKLEKGKTYYLYIQTETDSTTPYYNWGMEQVGYMQTLSARKLFVYKYE